MQLLDGLFRSPAVEPFFTDVATVQAILDFEAALARAQVRAGIIPQDSAAAISASCRAELFDFPALAEAVPSAGNLAIPLVKQLTALIARSSPGAARYVHYGATSQDALDTGLALQLRRATHAIESDLDSIISALASLTSKHRKTLLVARTWMQHALPTTFGFITAGWLDACLRHRTRLESLLQQSLALQFGGAAGTLAALQDRGSQIAALLAEDLALPLPRIPWQSQRERIGEAATTYGLLSATFAKIARDLSLHMQTEIAELAEPDAVGRGGSSTMPHKQNPVACAAILATTSRVPPLVATILSSLPGEYQRSLGSWQSEWETVPEIVRLAAGASHRLASLVPDLVVNADRMRSNLDLTHGLIYAEAVTFALGEKLDRARAQQLVEEACRRARAERRHLREVLSSDPKLTAILDANSLARLFEPASYLGSAEAFIDAVLGSANSQPKSSSKSTVTG
jgi:3-carboxy-cis,cis-muconate cycloisomerase